MSEDADVVAYRSALEKVGVRVALHERTAKAVRDLQRLAVRGTPRTREEARPECAAPRAVAIAITHGVFQDGKRAFLAFPPEPDLLACVSTWADGHGGRFGSGSFATPLAEVLEAIVYGLALGGETVTRDPTGTVRPERPYGHSCSWFEVQVPDPVSHGLPRPCFLRGLRDEDFWVSRVHLLRGIAREPIQRRRDARKPKKVKSIAVRLVVPGRDPEAALLLEAWDSCNRGDRAVIQGLAESTAPVWES